MSQQIVHGDIKCDSDATQRSGPRQTSLAAFDLIKCRPGNLGAACKLIRTPSLGVPEITDTLSQGDHHATLFVEVRER